MQTPEELSKQKEDFIEVANSLYHAKIHAFIAGFIMAIFMIGISHLFILKVMS